MAMSLENKLNYGNNQNLKNREDLNSMCCGVGDTVSGVLGAGCIPGQAVTILPVLDLRGQTQLQLITVVTNWSQA